MKKMHNNVQNYAWGSVDALTNLYGISNPQGKPMAELWMGAHPKSSSSITDNNGNNALRRTAFPVQSTVRQSTVVYSGSPE
jgi:mannose-6-phosphate isomerase